MVLYMTKVAERGYKGGLLVLPRLGLNLSRREYAQGTKDTETLDRPECPARMQARRGTTRKGVGVCTQGRTKDELWAERMMTVKICEFIQKESEKESEKDCCAGKRLE